MRRRRHPNLLHFMAPSGWPAVQEAWSLFRSLPRFSKVGQFFCEKGKEVGLTRHQELLPDSFLLSLTEDFFCPTSLEFPERWRKLQKTSCISGSFRTLAPLLVCCPEAGYFFLRKRKRTEVNKASGTFSWYTSFLWQKISSVPPSSVPWKAA